MGFVPGPVRVSVPATSANLGPGFDTLGIALDLWDELEAEVLPGGGLEVVVEGEGVGSVPLDETHLVVGSMYAAFDQMGGRPPGLRLRCLNVIPHARGLGSSSAAIVGGIELARGLVQDRLGLADDDAAFRLAALLEGHPDNVAPAFYHGFTISGMGQDGSFWSVGAPVAAGIGAVVFVPPDGVSTEAARDLLPDDVPHGDAAANAGRAALLVTALAGRPELLWLATQDRLHQDYREPAMPATLSLVRSLRADGHAAVVSGAGPTVLVLTARTMSADRVEGLLGLCPAGWVASYLSVVTPRATDVGC
jgi:homoserine kinase